ncbi:MAG: PilZ domain-containing protein [Chromatiales bacterium]|nr:PilZ domain-containing protein [Chromatiales bacterium]
MSDANRRQHERHAAGSIKASLRPVNGGLLTRLKKPQDCMLLDLSRAGAGILSTQGLEPSTEIQLALETEDGLHLNVRGVVRFTNPVDASHYRMGIHFHGDHTPETLQALQQIEARFLS